MEDELLEGIDGKSIAGQAALPGTQWEWFSLLKKQVDRYTMRESSSIPVETAEELMSSLQFCVRFAPEQAYSSLEERWESGMRQVWEAAEATKPLLDLAASYPSFGNQAWEDTLAGLGFFFRQYDWRFLAHQIPGMIDYPLCLPVPDELTGIRFIREYLIRMTVEGQFCTLFPPEAVKDLLRVCYADYQGLIVNLFEPALYNCAGRVLLGLDSSPLHIGEEEQQLLVHRFGRMAAAERQQKLAQAADRICRAQNIVQPMAKSYIGNCVRQLAVRMQVTPPEAWHRLFIRFL